MAKKKKVSTEPTCVDIYGEDIVPEEPVNESQFSRRKYRLFDFMGDLTLDKNNILRQDVEAEKDFHPFIINRGMSMGIDTVLYANEMNFHCGLSKQMVYDFYIHSLRPGKRYNKWAKNVDDKTINLIREYYQLSLTKAWEAMALLTDEDIEDIKIRMDKGGVK